MSLRGPATQHLHNEARRAEFDGMGWDGMGWMGQRRINCTFLLRIQKNPPETHWNHTCVFAVKLTRII